MTHEFDEPYWEAHWRQTPSGDRRRGDAPNPYLVREISRLTAGTALDAGCGEGGEAIWLASQGWAVTAADISSDVLKRAAVRADERGVLSVHWVHADLTVWEPGIAFDLVTTHYAHPSIPQLDFYERISHWVAPGGTLLIVGHLHTHGHDHQTQHPPAKASVTSAEITTRLDPRRWEVVTATEASRSVTGPSGQQVLLDDVVVRARLR
jgi:SAM-dependent methyltransferase